jgi:hypothetical protein
MSGGRFGAVAENMSTRPDRSEFDDLAENCDVTAATIVETRQTLPTRDAGRRTDPLRTAPVGRTGKNRQPLPAGEPKVERGSQSTLSITAAAGRRSAQFPAFAPLLEELEVAGWSSHRRAMGSHFHDWMLLDRAVLVMAGRATGAEAVDPIEAALVAQSAWAAVRAHAQHCTDAGALLTLAAQSLWSISTANVHTSVAVARIELADGRASLASAGDVLAWKVRAASTECLTTRQSPLGASAGSTYFSQSIQLSVRDRLVLDADDPQVRPAKFASTIAARFAQIDAESHRRMMASDVVALMRQYYEQHADDDPRASASIVAVRRR